MKNPFPDERKHAAQRPEITDRKGRDIFERLLATVVDSESAATCYLKADQKRLGKLVEQHEAAYIYLALAIRLLEDSTISVNVGGAPTIPATKILHFAGHGFRQIGQLNRAADAYWRAGVISDTDGTPDTFAVRSLARAKMCYAEVGQADCSDRMHFLEWEARRLGAQGRTPILTLWRITSCYGTSLSRWLAAVALFVLLFAITYEALHAICWITSTQRWYCLWTAAYYCVVTTATVGYGDIIPTHLVSQTVVALNIACAYFLLATGATILGRKVLGR